MEVAERLLTVKEVADMTGLPVSWIYSKAEDGTLPHFKLGKYLRFRVSEVTAWLETLRRGGHGHSAVALPHSREGVS